MYRRSLAVFQFVLVCGTLSLLGCSKNSVTLVGTWVNQSAPSPYKYIYTADGKIEGYLTEDMQTPGMVARYTVEKSSTDANGDTLYHVRERWSSTPFRDEAASTWYTIIKVKHDGRSFEHDASMAEYPPDDFKRGPVGFAFHHIYALQRK